jgi:hypothetical protein
MNDSSSKTLNRAPETWSYHAGEGAVIWQLMFTSAGHVIGQKRVPASRLSYLFCLSADNGKVLSDNYLLMQGSEPDAAVGEGWLVGLETTFEELVLCHAFFPGTPEHQGLWAIDPAEEKVVWKRPELVFAANLGSSLLMYRNAVFAGFPERDYVLLDPRSGREIELPPLDHEAANRLRSSAEPEELRQGIVLPETAALSQELMTAGGGSRGASEVIVLDGLRVEAIHEISSSSGLWRSEIRAYLGGETFWMDTMAEDARQPACNNFLVNGSSLYYIKSNEELVQVSLP